MFQPGNVFKGWEQRGRGGDVRESDAANRPDIQDHEDPQVRSDELAETQEPLNERKGLQENLNQDLQVGSTYNRPPDTCSNIAMQVVIIIIRPPRELINIKIPIITIIIL